MNRDKSRKPIKSGRRKRKSITAIVNIVFAVLSIIIIAAVVFMVVRWNRGEDSDYNPLEDTSEFDVEANDYIQPLSAGDIAEKNDDGETKILALGNSPFADLGEDNYLAAALKQGLEATVINGGIEGSFLSCESEDISGEMDCFSLYPIVNSLCTGDFTKALEMAQGTERLSAIEKLAGIDMMGIDCIMIMYDLKDYIEKRPPQSNENDSALNTVAGNLNASLKLLREKYPFIRIVVLSTPACGETIDDYYVDGELIDLGYGTLTDYMGHEIFSAVNNGVSFIDIYYGVINLDNRDEFLYEDYHINEKGAKAISERIKKLIQLE